MLRPRSLSAGPRVPTFGERIAYRRSWASICGLIDRVGGLAQLRGRARRLASEGLGARIVREKCAGGRELGGFRGMSREVSGLKTQVPKLAVTWGNVPSPGGFPACLGA